MSIRMLSQIKIASFNSMGWVFAKCPDNIDFPIDVFAEFHYVGNRARTYILDERWSFTYACKIRDKLDQVIADAKPDLNWDY